jgi:outer membrane protein assembly factor BamB
MKTTSHRSRSFISLVAMGLFLICGHSLAAWNIFHGDPQHRGYSPVTGPADSSLVWSLATVDSIYYSSPVLGPDGTIYFGNADKELVAVAPDGTELWRYQAQGNIRYGSAAVAADGTIYIGSADGVLHAVAPDGTPVWTYQAGGAIKTSPNLAPDGTIYFGADDGKLYALTPSGSLLWTFQTGDTIRSSPAVAPDGTIVFGSQDFFIYALNPDGTLRWSAATGDMIRLCSAAISDSGDVYIGSYDGFLYAFTIDGVFQWAYFTGHKLRSTPAIGPDGSIYFGAGSTMVALDTDGTVRWDHPVAGRVYAAPAVVGDPPMIYFPCDAGIFYALGQYSQEFWTFTTGIPTRSSPGVDDSGVVYFADFSGMLYALGGTTTGADEPELAGSTPQLRAYPNPSSGTVFFRLLGSVGGDAEILVYDAQGRRVARLPVSGTGSVSWEPDRLPTGVYLYRLRGTTEGGRILRLR